MMRWGGRLQMPHSVLKQKWSRVIILLCTDTYGGVVAVGAVVVVAPFVRARHSVAATKTVAAIKVSLKLRALSCQHPRSSECVSVSLCACSLCEGVGVALLQQRLPRWQLEHMFSAIRINKIHLIWRFGSCCGFFIFFGAVIFRGSTASRCPPFAVRYS